MEFQSTQRNNDETQTTTLRFIQNSTKKAAHPQYSHNVACVASRVHWGLHNHIGIFHFWTWEQRRHSYLTDPNDAVLFCNPAMHISYQWRPLEKCYFGKQLVPSVDLDVWLSWEKSCWSIVKCRIEMKNWTKYIGRCYIQVEMPKTEIMMRYPLGVNY